MLIFFLQGASVLLMLSSTMSEEKFHKGVTDYLQKYKEKNADTEDFWKSLPLVTTVYSVVGWCKCHFTAHSFCQVDCRLLNW